MIAIPMNQRLSMIAARVMASTAVMVGFVGVNTQAAQAALLVDIFGIPGSGVTTWTFSGSSTATEAGEFVITDIGETDSTQWKNIGDYVITELDDFIIIDPASTASVTTTTGGTQTITGVLIDRDGDTPGTKNDDWAIVPFANLTIGDGDTVSWTGVLNLNVDINNFFLRSVSGSDTAPGGLTDTQLTFAAPEPLTLLGASVAIGFGTAFKRRKAG